MKLLQEEQLLQQMREGDKQAMASFYRQESPYLFAVCRRYVADAEDAKDVLQESFVKILSSIKSFDARGEGALRAWTTRITVNCALNFMRDKHRLCFVEADDRLDIATDNADIVAQLSAEQIQSLIIQLPVGYRTVFNLYAVEGMSHREIAKLLHITESTSASQYHRAKALLQRKINELFNPNRLKDE